MSRTIITNSGSEFFTNISSEQTIGILCKISGAKHHIDSFASYTEEEVKHHFDISMPYDVTEEEANDIAEKLLTLIPKAEEVFPEVKIRFSKQTTIEDFKLWIQSVADDFKKSKGYTCAS